MGYGITGDIAIVITHDVLFTVHSNLAQLKEGIPEAYEALKMYVLKHKDEEDLGLKQCKCNGNPLYSTAAKNSDPTAKERLISNLRTHFVEGNTTMDDFKRASQSIADQISSYIRYAGHPYFLYLYT